MLERFFVMMTCTTIFMPNFPIYTRFECLLRLIRITSDIPEAGISSNK